MLNLSSIAIEPELADNGVWAEFSGGQFLLARPGEKYQNRLVELYNENIDLIKSNSDEGNLKASMVFKQAYAETVLLDWKDIVDDSKTPVTYTSELGLQVLMDPRQRELAIFIERFVSNRANYQERVEQEVADDVKSSAVS